MPPAERGENALVQVPEEPGRQTQSFFVAGNPPGANRLLDTNHHVVEEREEPLLGEVAELFHSLERSKRIVERSDGPRRGHCSRFSAVRNESSAGEHVREERSS